MRTDGHTDRTSQLADNETYRWVDGGTDGWKNGRTIHTERQTNKGDDRQAGDIDTEKQTD